ncbi:MAG TPA: organomercurial lyase, partial [Terriglobales bacterium]|nr:organomercurial lyase [Terriglobales bacterium]
MPSTAKTSVDLDRRVRLFVYRHLQRREKCPTVAEIASSLHTSTRTVRASLARLSESHAFMTQENGELWRAAPFSCIPTGFPVTVARKSWFGNCIWDALGIPAMMKKDAHIGS